MEHNFQHKGLLLSLSLTVLLAAGCNKSSSSGSALTLSGTLSNTTTSSLSQKVSAKAVSAYSFTGDKVVCATASTPPVTGEASVNSDGSFSVDIPGATGQPLACYMVDSNGDKIADFLISDSSNKDMNGNNSVTNTAAFSKSKHLGTISYNPDSGEATIPASNISDALASTSAAGGSVFDPTGSWTIAPVDFTLPSGVNGPTNCGGGGGGGGDCDGPPNGQNLYFKMFNGTKTSDSSTIYALQLWASHGGGASIDEFTACGSKTGLTNSLETSLGIDFTNNGASDAAFTFTSHLNGASEPTFQDQANNNSTAQVALTANWKMSTAKTLYPYNNCGPKDLTIGGVVYHGWDCTDNSSHHQVSLGGGCKSAAGTPLNISDWSQVTNWQSVSSDTDSNGIQSSVNTATYNSATITCTNKWVITDSSYVVQPSPAFNYFNWNDVSASEVAAGTACNNGSLSALQQLQCYSNYYYMSGLSNASGACLPKIQTNWSTTDVNDFVHVDFRPSNLVFMDQYKPFPDGNGGSMLTRQDEYRGVRVSDGTNDTWINCHVIDTSGITMKKISDSKIFATYQSSTVTSDKDIPACAAEFNGSRKTFFFYLTK